jgi:hypothetical protein
LLLSYFSRNKTTSIYKKYMPNKLKQIYFTIKPNPNQISSKTNFSIKSAKQILPGQLKMREAIFAWGETSRGYPFPYAHLSP